MLLHQHSAAVALTQPVEQHRALLTQWSCSGDPQELSRHSHTHTAPSQLSEDKSFQNFSLSLLNKDEQRML